MLSASCAAIFKEYSVESVPETVISSVKKLGSVSAASFPSALNPRRSNLNLIVTSVPAVEPLNVILPPNGKDNTEGVKSANPDQDSTDEGKLNVPLTTVAPPNAPSYEF